MPTATSLRAKSLEDLLAQAGGSFGGKTPEIAGPAPALYGVYGSAEAGAQQALTADPYFGAMHLANLGNQATDERQMYEAQLAAQQKATLQAQETAGYYGLQGKVFDKMPDDAPIGTFGVGTGLDGHYGLKIDPVYAAADNATKLDKRTADNFATRAGAYGVLARDVGAAPSMSDLSLGLRSPLEAPGTEAQYHPYMNPANSAEATRVSKLPDQADRLELQRLINDGDLSVAQLRELTGQGKVKAVINGVDGTVTYTVTGDYEGTKPQVAAVSAGARRENGLPPNPDAGVHGVGTSATQGTQGFFSPSRINSKKGVRTDPFTGKLKEHKGTDYRGKEGEIFPAEHDGEVIAVGPKQGFGDNVVTVRYDNGETAFYGHGRRALVQTGQRVKAGQGLGEVGSEGKSTGPHVHKQILTAAHRNVEGTTPAPAQVKIPQGSRVNVFNVIMTKAAEHNAKVDREGNNFRVTLPDGRSRLYDATGKVVG